MTIKKEAAFHEAGHAVVAFQSRFHAIVKSINLENYGAGEIFVSLSKSKLQKEGLPADPSSQTSKDVAADLAIVLSAGLVAERPASLRDAKLTANARCAIPDYDLARQQLHNAGLSEELTQYEEVAKQVLSSRWEMVEKLASILFYEVTLDTEIIYQILQE
jgi:ATP-dependent Zn protease